MSGDNAWTFNNPFMGNPTDQGTSGNPFRRTPATGNDYVLYGTQGYTRAEYESNLMFQNENFADSIFGAGSTAQFGGSSSQPAQGSDSSRTISILHTRGTSSAGGSQGSERAERQTNRPAPQQYPWNGPGDPPSGGVLEHHPNVKNLDPLVTDETYADINIDGFALSSGEGKKMHHGVKVPVQLEYGRRVLIRVDPGQKLFDPDVANTTISALLRTHFRGHQKWSEVSRDMREQLWEEFGLRFRWDCSSREIYRIFEKVCMRKYQMMMDECGQNYRLGKRVTWLQPRFFRHLMVHRWQNTAYLEMRAKMSPIRGVEPTFYGGRRSLINWQRDLDAARGIVPTVENPTIPSPATYLATKKKGTKRTMDKIKEAVVASQERASPERDGPVLPNLDVLGDVPADTHWGEYQQLLSQQPTQVPIDYAASWNVPIWNQAVGGYSHGRIPGYGASIAPEVYDAHLHQRPVETSQPVPRGDAHNQYLDFIARCLGGKTEEEFEQENPGYLAMIRANYRPAHM